MLCSTQQQLDVLIHHIVAHKGEGVILQLSGSRYEGGRSSSLIKLKVLLILSALLSFYPLTLTSHLPP